MNIYLLQLVGKWLSLLVITIASFFSSVNLNEKIIDVENNNVNKNLNVVNSIVDFTTVTKYNRKLPSGTTKVLVEGEKGVVYKNDNGNIERTIKEMVQKVIEVGTGPYGEYIGRMTGYGPDCKGCTGIVRCPTKDKKYFNLYNEGIYYNDEEYGEVRILAAAIKKFPCGTIVEVDNGVFEPFIGVVLDTGQAMRDAWDEEKIWMDLAFQSEGDKQVLKATSYNVKYSVKRWGW